MATPRITRLLVPVTRLTAGSGGKLALEPSESHYLCRVRRMSPGDPVEIRDGAGGRYNGRLLDDVTVTLSQRETVTEAPFVPVHLAFAPPKGRRIDTLLEKATELGAAGFQPVYTTRSVVKNTRGLDRWRRVIQAAVKQSGAPIEPLIHEPAELTEWLPTASQYPLRLVASPVATCTLSECIPSVQPESVCILTGPEGGLTLDELTLLEEAGWRPFNLGSQILRAETAPLAALTIVRHRLGEFG